MKKHHDQIMFLVDKKFLCVNDKSSTPLWVNMTFVTRRSLRYVLLPYLLSIPSIPDTQTTTSNKRLRVYGATQIVRGSVVGEKHVIL